MMLSTSLAWLFWIMAVSVQESVGLPQGSSGSGGCVCSDHTETDSQGQIKGNCQTEFKGQTWCYLPSNSNCGDAKASKQNPSLFWSVQACQTNSGSQSGSIDKGRLTEYFKEKMEKYKNPDLDNKLGLIQQDLQDFATEFELDDLREVQQRFGFGFDTPLGNFGFDIGSSGVSVNAGPVGGSIGCFATTSKVETKSGMKYISELLLGDFVKTSSGGRTHFTEFIGWMDREKSSSAAMRQVSTSKGQLTLTGNHMVFTLDSTKYAEELVPGDVLLYWDGSQNVETEVTEIQETVETGYWSPLTRDGTLLVDGHLASCYATLSHQVADLSMSFVKAMPTVWLDDEESQHTDGYRGVVKMMRDLGRWVGVPETKSEFESFDIDKLDTSTLGQFFTFTTNVKTEL